MKKCLLKFISFISASVLLLTGCGIAHNRIDDMIDNRINYTSKLSSKPTITPLTISGPEDGDFPGFSEKLDISEDSYDIDDVTFSFSFGNTFGKTSLTVGDLKYDPSADNFYSDLDDYCDYSFRFDRLTGQFYTAHEVEIYFEDIYGNEYPIRTTEDWYSSEKFTADYNFYAHSEDVTIPKDVFSSPTGAITLNVRGELYYSETGEPVGEKKVIHTAYIFYRTDGEKVYLTRTYDFPDTNDSTMFFVDDGEISYSDYKLNDEYELLKNHSWGYPYKALIHFNHAINNFAIDDINGRFAVCYPNDDITLIRVYNNSGELKTEIKIPYTGELLLEFEPRENGALILSLPENNLIVSCRKLDDPGFVRWQMITDCEFNDFCKEYLRSSERTQNGVTYTMVGKNFSERIFSVAPENHITRALLQLTAKEKRPWCTVQLYTSYGIGYQIFSERFSR